MPIFDGDRAGPSLARVFVFFLISRSRILVKSDFRPFVTLFDLFHCVHSFSQVKIKSS